MAARRACMPVVACALATLAGCGGGRGAVATVLDDSPSTVLVRVCARPSCDRAGGIPLFQDRFTAARVVTPAQRATLPLSGARVVLQVVRVRGGRVLGCLHARIGEVVRVSRRRPCG